MTYKIARFYLSAESAAAATALSSLSYYYLANFALQYNQNLIMLVLVGERLLFHKNNPTKPKNGLDILINHCSAIYIS